MSFPETPLPIEQTEGILADPSALIFEFHRMKDGEIHEEEYLDWVRSQSEKVKSELLRRRVNPRFPGFGGVDSVYQERSTSNDLLIRIGKGSNHREKGKAFGVIMVNTALFRFDGDGALISVHSEYGHRDNLEEGTYVQDVNLEYLALDFSDGFVNYRNSKNSIDAGYLVRPAEVELQ